VPPRPVPSGRGGAGDTQHESTIVAHKGKGAPRRPPGGEENNTVIPPFWKMRIAVGWGPNAISNPALARGGEGRRAAHAHVGNRAPPTDASGGAPNRAAALPLQRGETLQKMVPGLARMPGLGSLGRATHRRAMSPCWCSRRRAAAPPPRVSHRWASTTRSEVARSDRGTDSGCHSRRCSCVRLGKPGAQRGAVNFR